MMILTTLKTRARDQFSTRLNYEWTHRSQRCPKQSTEKDTDTRLRVCRWENDLLARARTRQIDERD